MGTRRMIALLVVASLGWTGCGQEAPGSGSGSPAVGSGSGSGSPAPPPPLTGRAKLIARMAAFGRTKTYEKAVLLTMKVSGGKPVDFWGDIPDARQLPVKADRAIAVVLELQPQLKPLGSSVYRYERTDRGPHVVVLLATTDPYEALEALQPEGETEEGAVLDAEVFSAWLKELGKTETFSLVGIGKRYLELHFPGEIQDAAGLAKAAADMCPDITEDEFAEQLKERTLMLWWETD